MPRPSDIQPWFLDAVEIMARTGDSLKAVLTELGVEISNEEATRVSRRASFQQLLREARHRFFGMIGRDPNFTMDTTVGKLLELARKLEEEGQHDKSAEVLFKIAKMRGWVGPESQVSVFGELSQRDLDSIRKSLESQKAQSAKAN